MSQEWVGAFISRKSKILQKISDGFFAGAVPIKLQVTALLETVHAIPVIDVVTETTTTVQHPVLVSEGIVGNTGTPGMLGQEVVNGDMQSTSV